jgi:hypothetical protein
MRCPDHHQKDLRHLTAVKINSQKYISKKQRPHVLAEGAASSLLAHG